MDGFEGPIGDLLSSSNQSGWVNGTQPMIWLKSSSESDITKDKSIILVLFSPSEGSKKENKEKLEEGNKIGWAQHRSERCPPTEIKCF